MSKRIISGLAAVFCGVLATFSVSEAAASAQSPDEPFYASRTKGPFYAQSGVELRARKLARGVANVGLGWAEIPNHAFREAARTSPITGAVVGAGKGLYKGLKRTLIGAWEIVTFYSPGVTNFEPYIEPEVVFMEYVH